MRHSKVVEISHDINITLVKKWNSMIDAVYQHRNNFYQHGIDIVVNRFDKLKERVSGCRGNLPTRQTRESIIKEYHALHELIASLSVLVQLNFGSFEVVDFRHTLEVASQYVSASFDHFKADCLTDCALRLNDAKAYLCKAEIAISSLPDRPKN